MVTLPDRDPESVVAELRPNVAVLILPTIVLIAATAAAGYFGPRFPEAWQRWAVLGGAVLLIVLCFILPLWYWASRRYTVTTRRTILRHGMIVRHRREVLHARVVEVGLRRTPGQAFAGSGDVSLELDGGHRVVLRAVRGPRLVQAALIDLIDAERADREYRRRNSQEQPTL